MSNRLQRALSSRLAWRLSGVTYPTAIVATRGQLVTVQEYLDTSREQMTQLEHLIPPQARVLEFGCGLGGNLISLSGAIRSGLGLDVNPGYLRLAKRFSSQRGCTNLEFALSSRPLATQAAFAPSFIFSVGVFERLPREVVREIIISLGEVLGAGGRMALYFLSPRAESSPFTSGLGDRAYVFWTNGQVREMMSATGFEIQELFPWRGTSYRGVRDRAFYGDMYVVRRTREPVVGG